MPFYYIKKYLISYNIKIMNNVQKKKELQILKKSQTQSLWFWVLVLCISIVTLLFFAYLGAIFKNQYVDKYLFGNDLILAILIGIIIGLFLLLFAFIFLNIFKRLHIRDYFQYYAYVNSLRNNSSLMLIKDKRMESIYSMKSMMSRNQFIDFVANILEYLPQSIEYKNLANEIEKDFALHGFQEVNYKSLKSNCINRALLFNFLIPVSIVTFLIVIMVFLPLNETEDAYTISAISRVLLIISSIIIVVNFSIFVYEIVMLKRIKNIESFNNHFFFSFNMYRFKLLSSASVKIN